MKPVKFIILLILVAPVVQGQSIVPPKFKLSETAVSQLSLSEVWLMKNSIFAAHGRTFNTYELHAFFMKQPWYKPSENFKQSDLNETDRFNVDLLAGRESELRAKDFSGQGTEKRVNVSNVYNIFQYAGFNDIEKDLLSKNGFVAVPTSEDQLFHIYENNDYLGIPSFITTDAVLQLYHLFFDMTLRTIETEFLCARLGILIDRLISELENLRNETGEEKILDAIDFDIAYLSVCRSLLTDADPSISGTYKNQAMNEIALCKSHTGWSDSPLLGRMLDYSQFAPRGHYTRSKELERYFMAMMWLGNAGIELTEERDQIAGMLITWILFGKKYMNEPLIKVWKDIYEPTVFYVGLSDDTGPLEMKTAMDRVFPGATDPEAYTAKKKREEMIVLLPKEKISGHGSWGEQKLQFRLMGQRFIPDSYIFDRLTNTSRRMPVSLDIMAGFGNRRAYDLMMNEYKSSWSVWPEYPNTLKAIIAENKARSETEWKQNLYYHWLYNLKALYEIKNQGAKQFFMTTDGWDRKILNTSLASWSELRHNTILYAKQSGVAECGGDEGKELRVWVPEPPKGYVEPNTEFYIRMLSLMDLTISGLEERGMLDRKIQYLSRRFVDLLDFLKTVSGKENRNEKLSLEEYSQIQRIGSLLDNLTLEVLSDDAADWWQVEGPDRNMPVIADVHTADASVLEVGVGRAQEIFVIVEIEGKLKMTRGAIFSFYEFPWPASDRLTDEKWQDMLRREKAPEQPEWINYKSNLKHGKKLQPLYKPDIYEIPESSTEPGWKTIYYDTGC